MMKACTKCEEEYPATPEFFHRCKAHKDGLSSWCKKCLLAHHRQNNQSPKGKARQRASKLKCRFGISINDYNKMFQAQGGVCAICGKPPGDTRLAVDHDHVTDEVRGLLCVKCNVALGLINDDIDILASMASYLL